jgi:choline dehydrogenase-like flavoprotein
MACAMADASVMPRIVGGNTNAATIMIGKRRRT